MYEDLPKNHHVLRVKVLHFVVGMDVLIYLYQRSLRSSVDCSQVRLIGMQSISERTFVISIHTFLSLAWGFPLIVVWQHQRVLVYIHSKLMAKYITDWISLYLVLTLQEFAGLPTAESCRRSPFNSRRRVCRQDFPIPVGKPLSEKILSANRTLPTAIRALSASFRRQPRGLSAK